MQLQRTDRTKTKWVLHRLKKCTRYDKKLENTGFIDAINAKIDKKRAFMLTIGNPILHIRQNVQHCSLDKF